MGIMVIIITEAKVAVITVSATTQSVRRRFHFHRSTRGTSLVLCLIGLFVTITLSVNDAASVK